MPRLPTRSTAATSTATASRPSRSNRPARDRSTPRATWRSPRKASSTTRAWSLPAAISISRPRSTSWHGHWREWRGWLRGYKDHDEFGQSVTGQTVALIQAAGNVTIHAPKINNSGNVQANSVYLGGGAITNGITDFTHQTPGSTLPDSGISLANSALFGSGLVS